MWEANESGVYLASREVSCAGGRMQQLKNCNYSIMVEVDWIRAPATGWDQDRRPGNGHGLDIISLGWQLKTMPVNTLLLLPYWVLKVKEMLMCRQKKTTFVHKSALPTDVFRTHRHTHTRRYASALHIKALPWTHKRTCMFSESSGRGAAPDLSVSRRALPSPSVNTIIHSESD